MSNRRKIFHVHLNQFVLIIQGRLEIQGWPEDIRFIGFEPAYNRGCIAIIIESESFEEVPLGAVYPVLQDKINMVAIEVPQDQFNGCSCIAINENAEKIIDKETGKIKFRKYL